MYLATAGFDISQTDRYTAVTKKSEACVIATRDFDEGAELAQCAGSTAALTEQQDGELESDFSVIRTSRRGTFLFLGPARFVNVSISMFVPCFCFFLHSKFARFD